MLFPCNTGIGSRPTTDGTTNKCEQLQKTKYCAVYGSLDGTTNEPIPCTTDALCSAYTGCGSLGPNAGLNAATAMLSGVFATDTGCGPLLVSIWGWCLPIFVPTRK